MIDRYRGKPELRLGLEGAGHERLLTGFLVQYQSDAVREIRLGAQSGRSRAPVVGQVCRENGIRTEVRSISVRLGQHCTLASSIASLQG